MRSKTTRFETSGGTAYLTLAYSDEDKPVSLIINLSKTGSEIRCFSEAIGRLVTLALEKYSPETLAQELEGIVSEKSSVLTPSLPDSIAKMLRGECD